MIWMCNIAECFSVLWFFLLHHEKTSRIIQHPSVRLCKIFLFSLLRKKKIYLKGRGDGSQKKREKGKEGKRKIPSSWVILPNIYNRQDQNVPNQVFHISNRAPLTRVLPRCPPLTELGVEQAVEPLFTSQVEG